jgi:hypothetical protein
MPGVFVSSGVDLQVSGMSITFNTVTGEVEESTPATVSTRFDTWDHWLIVASESLDRTEAAYKTVLAAHAANDDNALGAALEKEFRNGMATVSAAASAVDAFYASVKERHGRHPDVDKWKTNRLARPKQVAETLRWAWNLNPSDAELVRTGTVQLYKLRDPALHSPAEFRVTELRQDIDRYVEWRFSWYRAENARSAVQDASGLIAMFLRWPDAAPESLREWVSHSQKRFTAATGIELGEPAPAADPMT